MHNFVSTMGKKTVLCFAVYFKSCMPVVQRMGGLIAETMSQNKMKAEERKFHPTYIRH
jgi:hypothetical protein